MFAASLQFALGLFLGFPRAAVGWRQFHAGASRFRQTDRDGLFRRARAMFAFADVFHFFADEFACLSRRRLSFSLVFTSPFECLFFWHSTNVRGGVADWM
jgi:hypothetical protein